MEILHDILGSVRFVNLLKDREAMIRKLNA
jgi:hypothetical protein